MVLEDPELAAHTFGQEQLVMRIHLDVHWGVDNVTIELQIQVHPPIQCEWSPVITMRYLVSSLEVSLL